MIFTTTLLKKIYANLLLTDADSPTYEILLNINTCMTLENFNQFFLIKLIKKLLAKQKMNLKGFQSINLLG